MTIDIEEDLILPIAVAIMTVCFTIGYQTLVPKSQIEELILHEEQAFRDLSATSRELDIVTKELNTYKATAESLESLGASPDQAKMVIKAAEVYRLDPKSLGH